MTATTPILLVAKPWRGGLAHYLYAALRELFAGAVLWYPTYPIDGPARLRQWRDRAGWRALLIDRIAATDCAAALFVNCLPEFAALPPHPGYVLWLTDAAAPSTAALAPFARIFLSDAGYLAELQQRAGTARGVGVLPFAHHPPLHRSSGSISARDRVCLIANRDPVRDARLDALLAAGLPLTVYGNHFLRSALYARHPVHFRPAVANADMGAVYARHALALNIHAGVVRAGTNMRTFECAGYGIAQLTDHRPGLDELFDPDREIAIFRDIDHAIEQSLRLRRDRREAQAMAARAQTRARAEHTYDHRLETLLRPVLSEARAAALAASVARNVKRYADIV